MINSIPYTLILLGLSALAMVLIVKVLVRQIQLFKQPLSDKRVSHFRNVLFTISLVIIAAGIVLMTINVFTLFTPLAPNLTLSPSYVIYSLAQDVQTLLLAYLLWKIYRLASDDFNDKE